MPLPKTKRARMYQLGRWLSKEFPCPYPVSVHVIRKELLREEDTSGGKAAYAYGDTYVQDGVIHIRLDRDLDWGTMGETLFHEWGHAVTLRHAKIEARRMQRNIHDDEFWLSLGRIWRRFHDENGWAESREF